jgi:hypothetical protein
VLGQRPLDADTAVNNFGKIISDMLRTMVQEEGEPMLETVATMRSRWVQEEQCKKSKSRPCDCAKIRNQCDRIKKTVLQMEFVLVNEHPDGISWLLLRMKHESERWTGAVEWGRIRRRVQASSFPSCHSVVVDRNPRRRNTSNHAGSTSVHAKFC